MFKAAHKNRKIKFSTRNVYSGKDFSVAEKGMYWIHKVMAEETPHCVSSKRCPLASVCKSLPHSISGADPDLKHIFSSRIHRST